MTNFPTELHKMDIYVCLNEWDKFNQFQFEKEVFFNLGQLMYISQMKLRDLYIYKKREGLFLSRKVEVVACLEVLIN